VVSQHRPETQVLGFRDNAKGDGIALVTGDNLSRDTFQPNGAIVKGCERCGIAAFKLCSQAQIADTLKRYLKGFDVIGVSTEASDMIKEHRKHTDVLQQLIKPDSDAYQKLLAQYRQELLSERTTPQEFF